MLRRVARRVTLAFIFGWAFASIALGITTALR
ncbi:hypothetical protein IW245_003676 [Longispora fulva]|uniref:Uncharacterized protein n=1 Tax=Longispora fulva TaxID=619741 RepID=A0A8J7GIR6_9ACTN|nr:hypothetical protein [Longispora fulva]